MAGKKFIEKQGTCLCCGNEMVQAVRLIRLRKVPKPGYQFMHQWLCKSCRVAPFYRGKFVYAKKEPKA